MPRYIYSHRSIVDEYFAVEAPSEDHARGLVSDGAPGVKMILTDWIDWYDDEYTLEEVEDEVVTFLHSKETA